MIRNILIAVLVAALLPLLGGCFPAAVTGATSGALMIADRRPAGVYLDDEVIENKIQLQAGSKYGDQIHLNATSYNRRVLLTGEVPSEEVRRDIEQLARRIANVRAVQNELVIGAPTSLPARSVDAFITSKVKARFVDAGKFHANLVKVVTEAKVVYLLGIVRQAEADAAVELARTTKDVARVVKIFEYLD